MPQMLSRVRTISIDLDTARVKNAKPAPFVHHGVAPQTTGMSQVTAINRSAKSSDDSTGIPSGGQRS